MDSISTENLNITQIPPKITKVLFDGSNEPHNISLCCFILGLTMAFAICWSKYPCCVYLCFLCLFHFLEYFSTAMWNSTSLSMESFLIPHSREYMCAVCAVFLENIVLGPKKLTTIGFILAIFGQFLRTLAMATAGSNFNHKVQFYKQKNHTLVQQGIYKYIRHPAYSGYFIWTLGTQILIGNFCCLFVFSIAMWIFFKNRILEEEQYLEKFFLEYQLYKQSTMSGIPFIK